MHLTSKRCRSLSRMSLPDYLSQGQAWPTNLYEKLTEIAPGIDTINNGKSDAIYDW